MKMKFFIHLLFLLNITLLNAKRTYNSPNLYWVYWKQFKCEITEYGKSSEYIKNLTCFAKSWSRNYSTINAAVYLNKPVQTPFISGNLAYKYGTIYREIINLPQYNVCEINELRKNNKLINHIYRVFNIYAPGLLHACPYSFVKITNISIVGNETIGMFAQGDYRANVNFYESSKSEALGKVITFLTINSPFKESYGKK